MDIALAQTPLFASSDRRRAATALALSLAAGLATQALFWRTGFGLNFWVWDLFVVGASATLLGNRAISPTAIGAMAACVLLGFSVVHYASDWTLVIAVPANLAILSVLPLLLRDGVSLSDLSRVPGQALRTFLQTPSAVRETSRLPSVAVGGEGRGVLRGITRGLLLGIPAAGFFALLLATDHDFAASLERIRASVGDVALFLGWSVVSAVGYLVTHALHSSRARAAAKGNLESPYREHSHSSDLALVAPVGRVRALTWGVVIGQVAIVFALFVGANLRHLFGGNAVVRESGGVTYAAYIHSGVTELVLATILAVCLVVAGHALLRAPGNEGPIPGGKVLAGLETALLVLTGITVGSCWQRLEIYEDAYGASLLRVGVSFVELSILGVLILTIGKALARRWTGYAGAILALGALLSVAATSFNADAYVARRNLDRAAAGKPLDVAYLASLSGDAHGVLDHPYVRDNPTLREHLTEAFCAPTNRDLRALRGLGSCAQP